MPVYGAPPKIRTTSKPMHRFPGSPPRTCAAVSNFGRGAGAAALPFFVLAFAIFFGCGFGFGFDFGDGVGAGAGAGAGAEGGAGAGAGARAGAGAGAAASATSDLSFCVASVFAFALPVTAAGGDVLFPPFSATRRSAAQTSQSSRGDSAPASWTCCSLPPPPHVEQTRRARLEARAGDTSPGANAALVADASLLGLSRLSGFFVAFFVPESFVVGAFAASTAASDSGSGSGSSFASRAASCSPFFLIAAFLVSSTATALADGLRRRELTRAGGGGGGSSFFGFFVVGFFFFVVAVVFSVFCFPFFLPAAATVRSSAGGGKASGRSASRS
mmetsp:Transcript_25815/g.80831  ORF Transcript_25815/g.80831 Transcript_25815/m.80831 type:complete len:330 (-) Transcript_25815:262-1251(-)